jgi:hypothetical protein
MSVVGARRPELPEDSVEDLTGLLVNMFPGRLDAISDSSYHLPL